MREARRDMNDLKSSKKVKRGNVVDFYIIVDCCFIMKLAVTHAIFSIILCNRV